MSTAAPFLRRWIAQPDVISRIALLAIVWIVFSALDASFASTDIVFSVLQSFAFLGLIAVGVGVAMIAGELDLSVASMAAVAGILAVKMAGLGLVPAIILAALIAGAFGVVQGACIAYLKINSIVFTIGTLFALRGVANLLTHSKSVLLPLDKLDQSEALIERIWIFCPYVFITIAVVLAIGIVMAISRWGREIYAIGGARAESVAAGVPQVRPLVVAFGISGFTAGLGGALSAVVAGSGAAEAYSSVLLQAVTAVLIGGIGLYGGRGTIFNVVIGCLILESFLAGLIDQGATQEVQQLATGGLLLLVVAVEFVTGLESSEDRRQFPTDLVRRFGGLRRREAQT
ncbi:MAG: ABC transporter permease [Actinobacteria bacterium]|nr:ABC transporter permease [Actinomycetota bacterium]